MGRHAAGVVTCDVCGNTSLNRTIEAREMMSGSREPFTYLECARCGCLRLLNGPDDMSRYYDQTYYSIKRESALRRWAREHPTAFRLGYGFLTGRRLGLPEWWPAERGDRNASVLDIGSGRGNLLLRLQTLGFTRLLGIDPFIAGDIKYRGGLTILRRSLSETEGLFDVIVMNHSFEHMRDPADVLRDVVRHLAPGGLVMMRTPVASSRAWQEYGSMWVQLDPPRHVYVHTEESIKRLAVAAGLKVDSVLYDSNALQFWGSEQYRRGIPFTDRRSYAVSPRSSVFSRSEIREFERRARELNSAGEGDQACFYLTSRLR